MPDEEVGDVAPLVLMTVPHDTACRRLIASAAVLLVLAAPPAVGRQSVLYGGGPLYADAAAHRGLIRGSGFTTLVIWTVHVEADGDLVLNNHKIVDDGAYVGRADWPAEVAAFKSGTTSVSRIELGLSGHESQTFINIRDLVFAQGTGSGGVLHRNFKVIRDRIPAIDGFNYDEESHIYDQNVLYTMKEFSLMLADLGFNVELDVFCCSQAWTDVFNYVNGLRPGTIDRIDLQCYAGGGGNDPCWWNGQFGGLRVTPGLWAYPSTESGGYWSRNPGQVAAQMGAWNSACSLAGGFMWYLDDMLLALDQYPVADYGAALNGALGIDPARKIAATLYQHSDHWGWSVEVGAGPWGEVEISDAGGAITDVSSLVVSTLNDLAYAQWAAARGISPGAMAGPGDDADGDGVTNLAEFAFDGDPSSPTRDGKTASTWQAAGSATYLVLTMPVRAGAVFSATPNGGRSAVRDGVSYRVEGGDGLVAFDAAVEEVIPALGGGLPALSVGWEYRSFRLAADTRTRPRGFLRVQAASAGP